MDIVSLGVDISYKEKKKDNGEEKNGAVPEDDLKDNLPKDKVGGKGSSQPPQIDYIRKGGVGIHPPTQNYFIPETRGDIPKENIKKGGGVPTITNLPVPRGGGCGSSMTCM